MPEAAHRLAADYRQERSLNLGEVIVVLPGLRAGRRLQELLAHLAEDEHLLLTPPLVVTEGRLPEMLYTPKKPFADELVQDLAWAQALRDLPEEQRQGLLPHPPTEGGALRWLELGRVLRRMHVELAADTLDFAAVRASISKLADAFETRRWEVLERVQGRYLALLDQQQLWDIQTARLKAIEFREIATNRDIILLGTVDLNKTLRHMLDGVSQRVTAYIVAPEDLAERFDAHGCLLPSAWCNAEVPLGDEQLRQVEGPVEQADGVSAWLAECCSRYCNDEVAIGVPDEALVPQLQRQLEQCGVRARWVEGARVGEAAPYRLLAAALRFVDGRRYDDLAALLRHPDLEHGLEGKLHEPKGSGQKLSLPAQLDYYYNARLPGRVPSGPKLHGDEHWPDLPSALEHIDAWLQSAAGSQPLRAWAGRFRTILGDIYGSRLLDLATTADLILHRTMKHMLEACQRLDELPEAMDTVSLSASEAFQAVLGPMAREPLPPPANPEAVEILGWLELPLDDSRALVVTSFNEGFVPKSSGADAFLPDRFRRDLGLLNNERRYARDAYATSVLYHSHQDLRVLFARRDPQDNPLQPSRLLFACREDRLVERARRWFDGSSGQAAARRLLLAKDGRIPMQSAFKVPAPLPGHAKLERMSVTSFKSYLACPYRYYLRHVRKLEAVDDAAREMDGGAFGELLHCALSALGRHPDAPRRSTRKEEIVDFLDAQLDQMARSRYGAALGRASVRLQFEQARRRLHAFAARQAILVGEGWLIVHVEDEENAQGMLQVPFEVDGEAIELVGRIDRIDFHQATQTLRILDYKTAEIAKPPEGTHRRKGDWIDLQLPLYRHLWRGAKLKLAADPKIELGYFNIPKEADATKVSVAEWDKSELAEADDQAREVVRKLRQAVFWPPVYPSPEYSEVFAAICLDNTYSRPALAEAT